MQKIYYGDFFVFEEKKKTLSEERVFIDVNRC